MKRYFETAPAIRPEPALSHHDNNILLLDSIAGAYIFNNAAIAQAVYMRGFEVLVTYSNHWQ